MRIRLLPLPLQKRQTLLEAAPAGADTAREMLELMSDELSSCWRGGWNMNFKRFAKCRFIVEWTCKKCFGTTIRTSEKNENEAYFNIKIVWTRPSYPAGTATGTSEKMKMKHSLD